MVAIIHVGTQEQFFGDLRPQPQPKRLAVGAWYRVTNYDKMDAQPKIDD